jgi:hypothetical protein
MHVRGNVRTIAVPVAVRAAGVSAAGAGVPTAAAVRTSRPGKAVLDQVVLDQAGATVSPVISARARGDNIAGGQRKAVPAAADARAIPGRCCRPSLALMTPAG